MKKNPVLVSLLVLVPSLVWAIDFAERADVAFLENYVFSTNRTAVVDSLQPESEAWFAFSVLNAQTAGDLAEADKLLTRWRNARPGGVNRIWYDLKDRQILLAFDPQNPKVGEIRNALADCGITVESKPRQVPLAPNSLPSVLDPKKISFDAFWAQGHEPGLNPNFAFLPFLGAPYVAPSSSWRFRPTGFTTLLPDTPGLLEQLISFYKDEKRNETFVRTDLTESLTLEQLEKLAEALKGTKNDLYGNADFARIVLAKLERGADEDWSVDPAAEEAMLLRRVAFTNRLKPSLDTIRLDAYKALLAFGREHAREVAFKDHFKAYLALRVAEQARGAKANQLDRVLFDLTVREDPLVTDYLSAFCRAGDDLISFADQIEAKTLARIKAMQALLSGRSPLEVNVKLFSESEFAALRERTELNWSKTNPTLFAADDDVKLALDVKNVKKMRLAIYELDPFEACRSLGGEVKGDIDLDGAVPTVERAIDFSRFPALVRHTENLILPELKKPGLYIVECSAAGRASRAVIRKGRLRATERRDAGGYIFCALDEAGHVVKGAKLRLGETVFTADEDGEIAVPFATDEKSAGRKTAVIGDGRLATTLVFDHRSESFDLALQSVLPRETLVAGRTATVLLRPTLMIAGEGTPIALLEEPRLTLTFTDLSGASKVVPYPGLNLADDAETVVTFTVPERLASVDFALEGSVKSAVTGERKPLSASKGHPLADPRRDNEIHQAFLRKGAEGYWIELRGLNGEPLASRAATLSFAHRAFKSRINVSLQTDDQGRLVLGKLVDIARVTLNDGDGVWDLAAPSATLPLVLTAAEGEAFEIPLRDLFAGEWPGARRLDVRVSLLERSAGGQIVANRLAACSYKNGTLRIEGLPAGDYDLTLRDRGETCRLSVAKTAEGTGEGGVLASAARSLTDLGDPSRLRIVSASLATNGLVTVRLAGATPATRVHLFAKRLREQGRSPLAAFNQLLLRPEVRVGTWGGRGSDYVSGRDLGEKLRYILDRRDQPHRVGNLLDRPSLLLNPWSVSETTTTDVKLGDGEDWQRAEEIQGGRLNKLAAAGAFGMDPGAGEQASCLIDFLPEAATVIANRRPDEAGVVTIDLTRATEVGLCAQDISIVVTDGASLDCVELLREPIAFTCRDQRYQAGGEPKKTPASVRSVAPGGALFDLLRSIAKEGAPARRQEMFATFAFVSEWTKLDEAQKRAKYDQFASHELDVFLYEQDRPFFDAVVKPHLVNKRHKMFIDLWLLDADLSAFAEPAALDELNAFEQCLLARRRPEIAPQLVRRFSDWCEAHPVAAGRMDEVYGTVFGFEEDSASASVMSIGRARDEGWRPVYGAAPCDAVALEEMELACEEPAPVPESVAVNLSSQRAPMRVQAERSLKAKKAVARRESRQLYRPPERTKEWVETHYWRLRQSEPVKGLVTVNPFWRDYAVAIAAGKLDDFASGQVVFAAENPTAVLFACAVTKEATQLVRPQAAAEDSALRLVTRYCDPQGQRANGTLGAEVTEEFVKGRVYEQVLAVTNPTDEEIRETLSWSVPNGAIVLGTSVSVEEKTVAIPPYSVQLFERPFYFPAAGVAGAPFPVLDAPSKTDVTSWAYVSQNATKGEVLAYLREKNLMTESVDLSQIAWRMKDGNYAKQVLDVLESRGVYEKDLWLCGLLWREAFDPRRVRQVLMRTENCRKIAQRLGPALDSPLVTVDPERTDLFEHKEYWPLINARAHAIAGASRLANQDLAKEYKAYLGALAAKRDLTADDRLLLAVYLVAQDRLDEARAEAAKVTPDSVETKLQLAYLNAYLAFCDGDAEKGRAFALPYANHPVAHWQRKFREVIAQADEVKGAGGSAAEADRAPTLALTSVGGAIRIASRNLARCTLKAYPTDIEILFSKNPFGGEAEMRETVRCLKPAWEVEVELKGIETAIAVPERLAAKNLVVIASGAEGRAEARLEVTPRVLDVQVSREYRQLRVRDAKGNPLPGTYVKVYVKNASGTEVKFHKDGYTDLRGAFDYASVSTDTDFQPAEYAILVLHDTAGVRRLRECRVK